MIDVEMVLNMDWSLWDINLISMERVRERGGVGGEHMNIQLFRVTDNYITTHQFDDIIIIFPHWSILGCLQD